MTRLFRYLFGYIVVEICGAAPQWALNLLLRRRIPFWNIKWQDQLTVHLCICEKDLKDTRCVCEKAMCDIQVLKQIGTRYTLRGVRRRPVLLVGLLCGFLLAAYLQTHVLFYQVVGNITVPKEEILRQLQVLDVGFGTWGPSIRPQHLKDHLLQTIPQLQWVSVVQNGCRAQVIVRERTVMPETENRKSVAHVVASRGGIITSQSVLAGQAMQKVGDTVTKGQLLVSGFVDLERTVLPQHAQAEIYARTWYETTSVLPDNRMKKASGAKVGRCIWLRVGEKRLKICGNSGIYDGACDKMSNSITVTLPGGWMLPVSLDIQTVIRRQLVPEQVKQSDAEAQLRSFARQYLLEEMIAGRIVQHQAIVSQAQGLYRLQSVVECHEMIARSVDAEW